MKKIEDSEDLGDLLNDAKLHNPIKEIKVHICHYRIFLINQ